MRSIFELHDAFTIMSALSLEAAGFAGRGQGVRLVDNEISLRLPISTMGGLKARSSGRRPASTVVEAVLQLRGQAGVNQLPGAGYRTEYRRKRANVDPYSERKLIRTE